MLAKYANFRGSGSLLFLLLTLTNISSTLSFAQETTITIVYNNVAHDPLLQTDWGMAMVINFNGKTILFDTGKDSAVLLSNMAKLGINPAAIDKIFLSHIHSDHTGGVWGFLDENNKVTVYLHNSFPINFTDKLENLDVPVEKVSEFTQIDEELWSTGPLGEDIPEHSLVMRTDKGLVIITGCAHPGIEKITRLVADQLNEPVYLLIGGFHLMRKTQQETAEFIQSLKDLDVAKVAPSHCTGGEQISQFREAWGTNFIDAGCGMTISIN